MSRCRVPTSYWLPLTRCTSGRQLSQISQGLHQRHRRRELERVPYRHHRATFLKALDRAELGEVESGISHGSVDKGNPVVLLFKNDLRLDDHPGLCRALESGRPVIPFYCLDVRLVHSVVYSSGQVELLWGALQCLRSSLRSIGNDLVFRIGDFTEIVVEFMEDTGSTRVITETEVDARWRQELQKVKTNAPGIVMEEWRCYLHDPQSYTQNFKQMKKRSPELEPLSQPTSLAPLAEDVAVGALPALESFRQLLTEHEQDPIYTRRDSADPLRNAERSLWGDWSAELTSDGQAPIRLLQRYLSMTKKSTANRNGSGVFRTLVSATEEVSFPGISFTPMFSGALSLGMLSPRRVCYEVQRAKDATGIWLWDDPFHSAAKTTSESYDFHNHIAEEILRNGCSNAPGNSSKQFWRWHGILAEYSVARPTSSPSKGSVVLVHGFGASCMHWRRNVDALTEAGYTVYCPSLPGYGRTQKLYMIYTQLVWDAFLTDFITDIVGEPVVLGGNSIGAYVTARTAARISDIVSGLVLINPAGRLDTDYVPATENISVSKFIPPSFVVDVFARALLFYLEKSAGRILKSVYPVRTENADDAFLNELLRASFDPNAVAVLKSVFFLKKPIPLNYLLSEMYRKPVLLLQGARDPLNDAVKKGNAIRELCPNVQMELLEAGHCSHDEVPDLVNARLIAFLTELHEKIPAAVV